MSATAANAEALHGLLTKLGVKHGMTVQVVGYDSDSDESFEDAAAAVAGTALVDYDYEDIVDAVLLWHREDDGDLVDALVDAATSTVSAGADWQGTRLSTPKGPRR